MLLCNDCPIRLSESGRIWKEGERHDISRSLACKEKPYRLWYCIVKRNCVDTDANGWRHKSVRQQTSLALPTKLSPVNYSLFKLQRRCSNWWQASYASLWAAKYEPHNQWNFACKTHNNTYRKLTAASILHYRSHFPRVFFFVFQPIRTGQV